MSNSVEKKKRKQLQSTPTPVASSPRVRMRFHFCCVEVYILQRQRPLAPSNLFSPGNF